MQLEHTFIVPVPIEDAWRAMHDIGAIAACMPGSKVEQATPEVAAGSLKVKLGPLNLTYKGTSRLVESDESLRRAVVEATAEDARNGTAAATVVVTLSQVDETTIVVVVTDLEVTGKPAQFARSVMVDVGAKLVDQFAVNLAATIDSGSESAPTRPKPRPKPRKTARATIPAEATNDAPAHETPQRTAAGAAPDETPTTPPTDLSPVESAPVESAPVESAPAESTVDESAPAEPSAEAAVDEAAVDEAAVDEAAVDEAAIDEAIAAMTDAPAEIAASLNGHGTATPAARAEPTVSLIDSARPAIVKGLAPVALAVVLVLGAARRRRGKRA